jgi:hypothetical protein
MIGKPSYRVPTHTEHLTVSLDDFDDDEIVEYLRHRGFSVIGGSSTGSADFEDHIAGVELDHIFTLALCGQRQQAQSEALQLISRVVGRPI